MHGRRSEMLFFFMTPQRTLALYGLRWNVETDLGSPKRTVDLHPVSSKSQGMVEKEVLMAIIAYYLVRAVQYLSASRPGDDTLRSVALPARTCRDDHVYHPEVEDSGCCHLSRLAGKAPIGFL